jgi:hypothetical protein
LRTVAARLFRMFFFADSILGKGDLQMESARAGARARCET